MSNESTHWYMVDADGKMPLLRASQEEAKAAAAFYDTHYPYRAPHRAVQLVEVTPEVAHAAEAFSVLRELSACLDPDDWPALWRMLDLIDQLLGKVAGKEADHELSSTSAGLTS